MLLTTNLRLQMAKVMQDRSVRLPKDRGHTVVRRVSPSLLDPITLLPDLKSNASNQVSTIETIDTERHAFCRALWRLC